MIPGRLSSCPVFILLLLVCSCRNNALIPKPHAYPRILFPKGENRVVDENYCPLKFEFPTYGTIKQEKSFFDDKPSDPCWFTIQVTALNASIHCSYGPISKEKNYDRYIEDEFKLLGKHNIKAEYREETKLQNAHGVKGMSFQIDGPVATPYQFYLTDSVKHFFRAALYFNAVVNPDSTKPALDFLKKDLIHMQKTFEWKKLN